MKYLILILFALPLLSQNTVAAQTQSAPLLIDGPANIRNNIRGKKIAVLADLHPVRLLKISGSWAKISFTDQDTEATRTGWTHLQNLPHPGTLIANTNQFGKANSFLQTFASFKPYPGEDLYSIYQVQFESSTGQLLIASEGYLNEEPREVYFSLLYTGLAKYPLLLFYSGFGNDYGEDIETREGMLLLFHPDRPDRQSLGLESGDKVINRLVDFHKNTITVEESFHCAISVFTDIEVSEAGLKRVAGRFAPETGVPNSKLGVTATDLNDFGLEKDLLLFATKDLEMNRASAILMGAKYNIALLEIDYHHNLVKVCINGITGWSVIDSIKELDILNSMIWGNCGAG